MQKNILITLTMCIGLALVFLASRRLGVWLQSSDKNRPDQTQLSATQQATLSDSPIALSEQEVADGFRLVDGDQGNKMFVHPQSRSWLEVPLPIASTTGDADAPLEQAGKPAAAMGYLGPQACAECHRNQHLAFVETAHYRTSLPANEENILGSFEPTQNQMNTNQSQLHFEMKTDEQGHFFQDVVFGNLRRSFRADIATGAGFIGQTYLYWSNDALYQMHVSYFREPDRWVNSPGYVDGTAWYARKVIPKCVECHTTYMEWIPGSDNRYQKSSTILGVTCERCHGPGKEHVDFHQRNPNVKQGRSIVNPSDLSLTQQNDLCAQCHFGSGERLQPPFLFRPGDRLEDYWNVEELSGPEEGGVHSSNQLARLKLSECFQQSSDLTCISCHAPHHQERGDIKLFSTRCIKCHEPPDCGAFEQVGQSISDDCISCHMPLSADNHLPFESATTVQFPKLRDHYIRIEGK